MAEDCLGHHDQAKATLGRAEALIPAELRDLGTDNYFGVLPTPAGAIAFDWLNVEVLRREAAAKIRESAATATETPASPPAK
jgi:hypothetical protein